MTSKFMLRQKTLAYCSIISITLEKLVLNYDLVVIEEKIEAALTVLCFTFEFKNETHTRPPYDKTLRNFYVNNINRLRSNSKLVFSDCVSHFRLYKHINLVRI
jgi:hypothetical protein